MKLLIKLLVLLGLFVVVIWTYHGGFSTPKVYEDTMDSFTIATVYHQGDYTDVFKLFGQVEYHVEFDGLQPKQRVGIYYDDPALVAAADLRSDIGVIVEGYDGLAIPDQYTLAQIPPRDVVIVDFPYKTRLSMYTAIRQTYPAVNKYLQDNNYSLDVPRMEIYDLDNDRIRFIAEKRVIQQ